MHTASWPHEAQKETLQEDAKRPHLMLLLQQRVKIKAEALCMCSLRRECQLGLIGGDDGGVELLAVQYLTLQHQREAYGRYNQPPGRSGISTLSSASDFLWQRMLSAFQTSFKAQNTHYE